MQKLLMLTGLLCDLAGAVILAASLLGLERIQDFRHRLGMHASQRVVTAIRRLDQTRSQEIPHTVGPPWCVLFFLSLSISLPLFLIFLMVLLVDRWFSACAVPICMLHAYVVTALVALLASLMTDGWRHARRELLPITLGWPTFGLLPPLALTRLVLERLLVWLLGQWIGLAGRISALREDRFVGLLGLSFIAVGFLVQAVAVAIAD